MIRRSRRPRRSVAVVAVGERGPQLVEVADQGQREQLLLAGEVAVDDRPVDPDRPGDVLDLGVADAALVEEGRRGLEDLPLALAGGGRAAEPTASGAASSVVLLVMARHLGRVQRGVTHP